MRKIVCIVGLFVCICSCTVSPKKIEYGKDVCVFCDMTIVDKTHAAQYVTKKGRAYKFDAIECLINKMQNIPKTELSFVLVTDYLHPTKLIDASKATYLISSEIKSPMGVNLTAFSSENSITYKGNQYNWEEINLFLNKK